MKTIQKLQSNFVFESDYRTGGLLDTKQNILPTLTGSPVWVNTNKGKTFRKTRNGIQAYLLYTSANYNITSGTLIMLFRRNSMETALNEIAQLNTGYNIMVNNGAVGMYDYAGGTGFMSSGITINDREFHTVVIKFANGANGVTFYVDGIAGNTDTWTMGAGSSFLQVGGGSDLAYTGGADIAYFAVSNDNTITDENIAKVHNELMSGGYTSTLSKTNFVEPVPEELDSSLVGSWDMQEGGGVWSDLSSSNNNLTKVGQVGMTKGLFENCTQFDGASGYLTKAVADFRSTDSLGSITALIKIKTTGITKAIFSTCDKATNTKYFLLELSSTNKILVQNSTSGVVSTNSLRADEWYHIVLTSDGLAYKLYINGVPETIQVSYGTNDGNWFSDVADRDNINIGASNRLTISEYFNGQINSVKVYSKELSAAEVLADANKVAKKTIYRNTFEDAPVSLTSSSRELSDFLISSGTWKISQDTTKKKWLEDVTVGGTYINSAKAYGTWQFDFKKSSATSHLRFELIGTEKDSSGNGYRFNVAGTALHLITITAGGTATIAYTAAGYIAVDTKYSIRITRSHIGVFTVYIRGGAYTNWTAISVAGGGGSNPVTENTHKTSRFLAIITSTAVGNKVGNIVIKEGVCDVVNFPEIT